MTRRHVCFVLWVVLTGLACYAPLRSLLELALENDAYSHIIFIPFVSGFLIYLERRKVFARLEYSPGIGAILALVGIAGLWAGRKHLFSLDRTSHLSLIIFSLGLVWMGGFISCYGIRAFKAAAFPLLFLLLMVPVPGFFLNKIVFALQKASAETIYALFQIVGVPVLNNGFVFALPGFNIKIAPECSGIRSSLALLITSLLAGHFFLRSAWRKLLLSLVIIPITVLKNAIRIATISLLSVYVNRGFLTGNLHRHGGIPFSVIAVGLLVPILWWFQKVERHALARKTESLDGSDQGEGITATASFE